MVEGEFDLVDLDFLTFNFLSARMLRIAVLGDTPAMHDGQGWCNTIMFEHTELMCHRSDLCAVRRYPECPLHGILLLPITKKNGMHFHNTFRFWNLNALLILQQLPQSVLLSLLHIFS